MTTMDTTCKIWTVKHTHTHTHIPTQTHTYTHVRTHSHMHTHTRAHTHKHTILTFRDIDEMMPDFSQSIVSTRISDSTCVCLCVKLCKREKEKTRRKEKQRNSETGRERKSNRTFLNPSDKKRRLWRFVLTIFFFSIAQQILDAGRKAGQIFDVSRNSEGEC